MEKPQTEEELELKEDLEFYLRYYKEVSVRGKTIKNEFEWEIKSIIEALNQTGK